MPIILNMTDDIFLPDLGVNQALLRNLELLLLS